MTRMTQDELAAVAAQSVGHNAAVAADIEAKMAELRNLRDELVDASIEDADLRDELAKAITIFNHQYNRAVKPLLPTQVESIDDPAVLDDTV